MTGQQYSIHVFPTVAFRRSLPGIVFDIYEVNHVVVPYAVLSKKYANGFRYFEICCS